MHLFSGVVVYLPAMPKFPAPPVGFSLEVLRSGASGGSERFLPISPNGSQAACLPSTWPVGSIWGFPSSPLAIPAARFALGSPVWECRGAGGACGATGSLPTMRLSLLLAVRCLLALVHYPLVACLLGVIRADESQLEARCGASDRAGECGLTLPARSGKGYWLHTAWAQRGVWHLLYPFLPSLCPHLTCWRTWVSMSSLPRPRGLGGGLEVSPGPTGGVSERWFHLERA